MTDCGCKTTLPNTVQINPPPTVDYCRVHGAALDLLEAAKRAEVLLRSTLPNRERGIVGQAHRELSTALRSMGEL